MVLAELVASAADTLSAGLRQTRPVELRGRAMNEGLASGVVHLYDPVVPPARLFAADPELEERRLNDALEALRNSIDAMLTRAGPVLFGESRDVLETYPLFAHDPSGEAPPGRRCGGWPGRRAPPTPWRSRHRRDRVWGGGRRGGGRSRRGR